MKRCSFSKTALTTSALTTMFHSTFVQLESGKIYVSLGSVTHAQGEDGRIKQEWVNANDKVGSTTVQNNIFDVHEGSLEEKNVMFNRIAVESA